MSRKLIDEFNFVDWKEIDGHWDEKPAPVEVYNKLVNWALRARGQNPNVFDALTQWLLDDSQWDDASLEENEWVFTQGVLARFKEQNAKLRALLKELEPSGVVNVAIFKALDRFDDELSGKSQDDRLRETVEKVFSDFTLMKDRKVREIIAGNKTGPAGTDNVDKFGYVNYLKEFDAGVQWTLFMPGFVQKQQKNFRVDSFEYSTMPAMRFIGREIESEGLDLPPDLAARKRIFSVLDGMDKYKSGFDHDVLFMHHYGKGADVERWHGVWGRFMKEATPVPEDFLSFDFVPRMIPGAGPPYYSRFALATFSGDLEAMHSREGYDSDGMYDVTRNIILGEGVNIPYPDKYWTAEVFFDGYDTWGTGFLFSVGD